MKTQPHLEHSAELNIGPMGGWTPTLILSLPFILTLVLYLLAVISVRKSRSWPLNKTLFWITGVSSAMAAVSGPLAARAHTNFTIHMLCHLLLGMLAPLLMTSAAPLTLILRALPVKTARRLSCFLKSNPICFISHPITAAALNIGGLWVLYTSDLYRIMQQNMLLHIVIHLHIFLAGFLFTASIIYFDPAPHRKSFFYRSLVLLAALAGHGILAKYIYAHPPESVQTLDAERGGMLMYYGGDAIDLVLIILFFTQWYKKAQKKRQALDSYL